MYFDDEVIEIIERASERDVLGVFWMYVSPHCTYYLWREKFETNGEDGFWENYKRKDSKLKQAEKKVHILSKLLAKRDIE